VKYLFLLSAFLVVHTSDAAFQDSTILRFEKTLQNAFPAGSEIQLFLRFNQPEFVAGDTAFFSICALNTLDKQPIPGRHIINVVIADANGKQIVHQKVLVTDGFSKSQIVLPIELMPGRYGIIASPDSPVNNLMFFRTAIDVVGETYRIARSSPEMRVFVEGGALISGVTNKLVATGPPLTTALVVNASGTNERNISFNESGFSVFYLAPSEGESYSLKFSNGKSVAIPEAGTSRVAMALANASGNDKFNFVFQTSGRNVVKGNQTFVIYRYGQIYFKATLSFDRKRQLLVPIDMKGLPFGVYQAVLFDANLNVLSERPFLFRDLNSTPRLEIAGIEPSYNVRENVQVDIRALTARSAIPLSVSIYEKDLFKSGNSTGRYLDFQADIIGGIPDDIDMNEVNDYLVACTSVFSPLALIKATPSPAEHYPGHLILSGTIADLNGNPVQRDSLKISFFIQNDIAGYYTWADRQSKFRLPLLINFYGRDRIFYTIEQYGERLEDLRLVPDEYVPELLQFDLTTRDTGEKHPLHKAVMQRRSFSKAFETKKAVQRPTTEVLNPHAKIEDETVGVTAAVRLSDYLIFPTMEETLREVVPFVQHRWVNRKHRVRLWFDETKYFADGPPLYFIDGVATDDTDYFMSLDPETVQTIKIIASFDKLYVFGSAGRFGVILVETNIPGNASNVPSEHTFAATGLTRPLEFQNQTGSFPARVPDTRYNLYWNPEVILDSQGQAQLNFVTSDLTGEYVIVISGVSADGHQMYHEQTFNVVYTDDAN